MRSIIVFAIGIGLLSFGAAAWAASTPAPAAPTDVQVLGQTQTRIVLSWTQSVGAVDYLVNDGTTIHITTDTVLAINDLPTNRTYHVTVQARDAAGNTSVPSTPVSVTLENVAPSTPGNLRQIGTDRGQPVLGWDAATDNSGSIYRYVVRAGNTSFSFPNLRAQTIRLADYMGCPLRRGITYTLTVEAMDRSTNLSLPSNVLVLRLA
jgi:hypothetical protein